MGFFTPDPYYQPEEFGLTLIGSIQWGEPDYSFNLTAVWHDGEGQLYYADDSGCSCPSPFEDYTKVEDLTPCTVEELQTHLIEWNKGYDEDMAIADIMGKAVDVA